MYMRCHILSKLSFVYLPWQMQPGFSSFDHSACTWFTLEPICCSWLAIWLMQIIIIIFIMHSCCFLLVTSLRMSMYCHPHSSTYQWYWAQISIIHTATILFPILPRATQSNCNTWVVNLFLHRYLWPLNMVMCMLTTPPYLWGLCFNN